MKNFFVVCVAIVICRMLSAYVLPTFDDAFITFRYAYNLVSGHGLVYNTNEKIMGTTAPLFAIIACFPLLLSISVPKFFVLFNLLCDLCSLYLVYKYFLKERKISFLFFATLLAFDPTINRIGIGGMEANLFLLSSLSGIVLYLNNRKVLAFIILSVIYFLRPEAVILIFILLCYEMYTTKKLPLRYALVSALVLSIPLTSIYLYYGQVLPQSVVAKSVFGRNGFINLIRSIFFPQSLNLFIFPFAVFGFIRNAFRQKIFLLSGLWIGSYALAYFIKAPMIWTWYIYSIEFVQLIFAAFALEELLTILHVNTLIKPQFFYALPLIVIAVWGFVFFHNGRSGVEKNVYSELDTDFSSHTDRRDSVFFADDIGAIGYFTHGYIYDDQMLVTPQAAEYKTAYERIMHVHPDYLFVYTDSVYINLIRHDSVLSKKYVFVKRYSVNGEKTLPADFSKAEVIRYKQDYVLFRKVN